MLKSNFNSDLKKEQKLAVLLDTYYKKHFNFYNFKRVYNLKEQLSGIDLVLTHKSSKKQFLVDEKAQLDYINEDLPTFAFELSYFKNNIEKKGWLFDTSKKTDFYSLITSIYSDEPHKYTSCKITFVNRKKLLLFLNNLELNESSLYKYCLENNSKHGKIKHPKLNHRREGYLFISSKNKAEKPINLILRLDFLIAKGIAKQLV